MTKPKTLQELYARDWTWTQGAAARTLDGRAVNASNPKACCFCLAGALAVIYSDEADIKVRAALRYRTHPLWLSEWNDDPGRTIDDVRKLVEEAGV